MYLIKRNVSLFINRKKALNLSTLLYTSQKGGVKGPRDAEMAASSDPLVFNSAAVSAGFLAACLLISARVVLVCFLGLHVPFCHSGTDRFYIFFIFFILFLTILVFIHIVITVYIYLMEVKVKNGTGRSSGSGISGIRGSASVFPHSPVWIQDRFFAFSASLPGPSPAGSESVVADRYAF